MNRATVQAPLDEIIDDPGPSNNNVSNTVAHDNSSNWKIGILSKDFKDFTRCW